jgi:predicted Zn-dependent peptidase
MAALPSITPLQVQEVAKKYFVDEALTVAQLLPIPGARAPLRPMPPGARHSEALK